MGVFYLGLLEPGSRGNWGCHGTPRFLKLSNQAADYANHINTPPAPRFLDLPTALYYIIGAYCLYIHKGLYFGPYKSKLVLRSPFCFHPLPIQD